MPQAGITRQMQWGEGDCEVWGDPLGPHAADLATLPGVPERRTHDYLRHGTTSLFAALETAAR